MKKKGKQPLITGVFIGHARGFGFVKTGQPGEDDLFIPAKQTNGALHGDTVECLSAPQEEIREQETIGRREGVIVRVVKRGVSQWVGTFYKHGRDGYVIPMDKRVPHRFEIMAQLIPKGLADGHRVMIQVKRHQPDPAHPRAVITEVLGHMNDPGMDVLSIVRQYDAPVTFRSQTLEEANAFSDSISDDDILGRLDLRNEYLITIDGEDAKDLDDAVSLTRLPEGGFELGVHIADVTHYVRENSALDREAYERGTSIYLADRVIPMLPHTLSNGICSLHPGEDRLTLSCIMQIDANGQVTSHTVTPSVIHSRERLTYTEVNNALSASYDRGTGSNEAESITSEDIVSGNNATVGDASESVTVADSTSKNSPATGGDPTWLPLLRDMEALSAILRKKRLTRGALEFDFPESHIRVDESGWPVSVTPYERNTATGIIEEFMLIANETIAEQFFWLEIPFVYRVHEEPDPEKMRGLAAFLKGFGLKTYGNASRPKVLQQLLERIVDTPEEAVISQAILRSMQQARYVDENIGHYGLAAKYYCHFTSPIRRYPDLQIHRIIKGQLTGMDEETLSHYREILPAVCRQCSRTERAAESLEREVAQLKKVQFMSDQEGDLFEGIISGVTSWGVYVTLPSTIEGMIPSETLAGYDRFVYDETRMRFVGTRHNHEIRLGQKLPVRLTRANVEERKLYFALAL